jgi:uncharacterized membrane protein YphA (DoxX/SURF4 family)
MRKRIIFILRLIIGISFILSGITKMIQLNVLMDVVYQFNILPKIFIIPFASLLPIMELVFGIALTLGINIRLSSFMILLMLILMLTAIFPQLLGGNTIADCGCFGGLMDSPVNGNLFIRDIILTMVVWIIFVQKEHWLILDHLIINYNKNQKPK